MEWGTPHALAGAAQLAASGNLSCRCWLNITKHIQFTDKKENQIFLRYKEI
jgi:hypothetical protein